MDYTIGRSGRRRGAAVALCVSLVLGAASAATAQDPDPAETGDTLDVRPFVPGGIYDKPYLTTLLGRTALGGYAEAVAQWHRVDGITEEAGFEARRVNLFTSTRVSDVVTMGLELEIEEGGEEIVLEYAAVDVAFHPSLSLRAGMLLVPLGRFNLTHDAPRNHFTERPLVATEVLGVTLSQPGFGLLGALPVGGEGRITYEVYAVNGFDEGVVEDSPDGTRLAAGKQNLENDNRAMAVTGRVAWSPAPGVDIGLSGHHGAWNRSEADGLTIDEKRDLSVVALDFDVTALGITWQGEGALVRIDLPPGLSGIFQDEQRGLYLQGVRRFGEGWVGTIPGSYFEGGLRLDAIDFDEDSRGDSAEQATLGLAFRPSADTALKVDYVRGASFDAFNNRSDHAALLFSVTTYF